MPKVILYIAASLDGFIARQDDDFSWLDQYGPPEAYGYAEFMKRTGSIVMGSRTYEIILRWQKGGWTYNDHPTYVLTRRKLEKPAGARVEFYSGKPGPLVAKLKKGRKNVFHMGGGLSVSPFLNQGLIDEIHLFVCPILLGEGKPLFPDLSGEISLKLLEAKAYKSGIVLHRYKVVARAPGRKNRK